MQFTLAAAGLSCFALAPLAIATPPQWSAQVGAEGVTGSIRAMAAAQAGPGMRLFVAGATPPNQAGITRTLLRAWDGSQWVDVPGLDGESVDTLAVYPVGGVDRLVAGGFFALAGNSPIGILLPTGWQPVPAGPFGWTVGVGVYHTAAGASELFASAGIQFGQTGYVARYDGVAWREAGAGLVSVATSFVTLDGPGGPKLYCNMAPQDGMFNAMVSSWDGLAWTGSGSELHFTVHALATFDFGDGPELVAAGGDAFLNSPFHHIARLHNGVWTSLGSGIEGSSVNALAVFDDGDGPALYAGGSFTSAGGQPAANIARWKNGQWSALGIGTSGPVTAMAIFDEDGPGPKPAGLFVGGNFAFAGGQPALNIARWGRPMPCIADVASIGGSFGGDGQLTADDVVAYLSAFFAGNTAIADIASLGGTAAPDGQITPDDLVAFLATFFTGC